ncbi:MAG: choice-of-anchor B family protein [Bacteroidia bacterium]
MKRNLHSIILLLLVICSTPFLSVAQFTSQNISLLSTFDDLTVAPEPYYGIRYNGVWGWADGNGKEYAIIGATNGVYIVEVTNPAAPVQRDFVPGCVVGCIWRELKTYNNYLYMVSDDGGPNCLQIADLSYLPDSVHIVHQSNQIITRSHTIFIDGNKLYFGIPRGNAVGGGSEQMAVFSLANPASPVLLRKLSDDYPLIDDIHDMYVRNDTVYASASWGGLHIYKFNANNTFTEINSITSYPSQGYNHSSVLTDNSKTLIFTDEVPTGLPLKAYDITDLQNIVFGSTFSSTPTSTATPHNPFMMNDHYCVVAYYQDGLQIFDVSNPANVVRTGFFDTNPTDGAGLPEPDYSGCWGAYTELPSGNILASDMQNGLFVLDASNALGIPPHGIPKNEVAIYPNPVYNNLELDINLLRDENLSIEIFDVTGKNVFSKQEHLLPGKSVLNLNIENLSTGIYTLKIKGDEFNAVKQVVKVE